MRLEALLVTEPLRRIRNTTGYAGGLYLLSSLLANLARSAIIVAVNDFGRSVGGKLEE